MTSQPPDNRWGWLSQRVCTYLKTDAEKFKAMLMKDEARQAIEFFFADADNKMVVIYEVSKGDLMAVRTCWVWFGFGVAILWALDMSRHGLRPCGSPHPP
eukprot:3074541-Pyramimonas_sp.AAC.1